MINGSYLRLACEALRAHATQICSDAREVIKRSRALQHDWRETRQRLESALTAWQLRQDQRAQSRERCDRQR